VAEAAGIVTEAELPARRARITWASSIEPEPVVWAWKDANEGRIPAGSLSIAAGREGTGKSSYGIWLTAQITRGSLPGSFYGTPRRVLYVALEDSWKHTLVPRAIAAKADLSLIGRFEVVISTIDDDRETSVTLSLPHDNALLQSAIVDNDVALVVIDPLLSVIGGHIDTHRNREVRDALDPLVRIADETGAVIFGIAHFNKSGGTDAASLISGSGAFKDVPRSVFGFARDDENQTRIMSQVKNSLGRDELPSRIYTIESVAIDTPKGKADTGRFVFTGETDRTVADVLRDNHRGAEGNKRMVSDHFIAAYLRGAGGQAPANEVIAAGEAAGFKAGTLKNARGKVADTKSEGFTDKTHIWVLREEPPKSAVDHSVGHVGHTDREVGPTGPTCDLREPDPGADEPEKLATPGAPTDATPGMTDRVLRAVANASQQADPPREEAAS
jgi:hypothetical protein